jgi:hypothetical protein
MGQQHHDGQLRTFSLPAVLKLISIVPVVLSSMDDVALGVVNIGDAISEQQRTQIIEWLSPINFFLRQADISHVRHPETGGWLLVNPHFQEWRSGSGRTLWCHGIRAWFKFVFHIYQ